MMDGNMCGVDLRDMGAEKGRGWNRMERGNELAKEWG